MREAIQAPVSRETLREWLEDRYGVYMDVRHGEDTVLRLYNDTLFPEISVLFVGDASKLLDTVEICGMYDNRTGEFRFVSGQLSSIVDGILKEECCPGPDGSESIYAGIRRYAEEAVEQRGYTLVEQRERQEQAMSQTEQLLRRMTGSITEYVNTVGMRPLRMSDYDKAVLAIQDGELEAFKMYAAKVPNQQAELLVEAAGRPGAVGRRMAEMLMQDKCDIDYRMYCDACKKAIDINDPQKVLFMTEQARSCVSQLEPAFYGEMASYAYLDHRFIAKEIICQCSEEQFSAAPSHLLEQFATDHDFRTMSQLVEKGISGGSSSMRTLHMLTYEGRDSWMAESLLEKRMWVDLDDYNAFHACVKNNAVEVCKLLLDHGMDFEEYQQWAKHRGGGHEETIQALTDYWSEIKVEMEQTPAQEMGGQTFA